MTAKELFIAASELPPRERSAFLDAQCAGDATLRAAVEELLAANERAGEFLAGPTLQPAAAGAAGGGGATARVRTPATSSSSEPQSIGPYKLLQEIGEGGFGTVYLAEQEHPVRRRVAIKVIKLGMDTKQVIARFEAERQALAIMDHPNIAKVFDAGATELGRPYFVMELVKGVPITEYCDHEHLDIRQRLELFTQVCGAVQHAHQKGIIHRDLKPSNVLVSSADERPLVKVIDFGIAKATQSRLTEKTLFTELRQMIGTPEYMSPEQAEMGGLDIDTRTDIYSLGVLLYELLTGATPFDGRDLRSKAYAEMQRVIREVDPPAPSTRLSSLEALPSVAASRRTEPAKLSRTVRGELDWIVMKCLEKDRSRRYPTASGLVADVMHYLADEPVSAGPVSTAYRVRKFVQRNRAAVIVSVALLALLLAGITGTTIGLIGQSRQRRIAEREREEARKQEHEAKLQAAIAEAVSKFQSDMLQSADPAKLLGDKVTVLQAVTAAVKELDAGKLTDQPLVEASVRETIGNSLQALGRYDVAEPNLRKALELRRKFLPAGHELISDTLDDLGWLLTSQNKTAEAEACYREALAIRRTALRPDDPQTAIVLNDLGLLLRMQGKLPEAEALLRESLGIRRKAFPPGHEDIGTSITNLATVLRAQAKYAEAEALLRESLEMHRKVLPPGHPHIAGSLASLGIVLEDQGKLSEAEPVLREAVEIRRKTLPADHPDLAKSVNSLALLLHNQGRLAEAERLFQQALQILRKSLPDEHPYIATTTSNLALVLIDEGRATEAEPLLRQALEARRKSLPPTHPDISSSLNNLAAALRTQGRLAEAEAPLREALEIGKQSLPPDHPEVATRLTNLGFLLYLQNRPAEAEPLFREALADFVKTLGKDHRQVAVAQLGLGQCLIALNRYPEAEASLLDANRIWSMTQGETARQRAECIDALIKLYTAWDKADPGKGHDASAQHWRAAIPATHPSTLPATTQLSVR